MAVTAAVCDVKDATGSGDAVCVLMHGCCDNVLIDQNVTLPSSLPAARMSPIGLTFRALMGWKQLSTMANSCPVDICMHIIVVALFTMQTEYSDLPHVNLFANASEAEVRAN